MTKNKKPSRNMDTNRSEKQQNRNKNQPQKPKEQKEEKGDSEASEEGSGFEGYDFKKNSKIIVKKGFVNRYRALLGSKYDEFMKCNLSFLRRSFRINTLKANTEAVKRVLSEIWDLEQIPWCKQGFWISSDKRRDIGNHIYHQLGMIYVQEAASMIPPVVLDPKPGDFVLDMAAAPGSKTTQIAAMMENKGVIIANEADYRRLKLLQMNLQRCGVLNAMITNYNGITFGAKKLKFDKILLDAPCSGTGTIRKSFMTLKMWNEKMIEKLSRLQQKLIESAFSALKDGGILVYSTCSLEPFENERVVSNLIENHKNARIEEINLAIKRDKSITCFNGEQYSKEVEKCLRIYPQTNDTSGFFVCKIRKNP